ncbi:deubiquitinase DESI2-like [Halichondria panicea]|uniref:deubiquitinase DESI2-like n=1 Tax=Halichondria panicea TaxID=6063 RepID=UPI00312B9935
MSGRRQEETSLDSLLSVLEGERTAQKRPGSELHLNVYDMIWVNDYTSRFGIGAFHSGVQVYGREYAYGGHPYSFTGVYDVEPQRAVEVAPGLKFRESIYLGHTHLTDREVEELVLSVGKEFNGNDYHIFNKNCNHFTDALCMKLIGARTPSWVNRLAYVSSWMPFIINCLPLSWITPGGVEVEGQESSQLYSQTPGRGRAVMEAGTETKHD